MGSGEHFVFAYLEVSEGRVRGAFERYGLLDDSVHFLKCWFSESLPPLRETTAGRCCDSMTTCTSRHRRARKPLPRPPGGFVVIDDYGTIPRCREAVHDFRQANAIADPIEKIDWTGAGWRRSA